MVKAVLFDVDGVLIDSLEANFQFYCELLTKVGYTPPTFQEYVPFMHNTMEGVVRNIPHASDKEIKKIVHIGKEFSEELYPYALLKTPAHATDTLQQLYTKYILGIVTSRVKGHIYSMSVLSSLEKIFQVAVSFEDTNKHKPDPEPLLFACKSLEIKPEEAVYVGDAGSDLAAGKAAGMKVILFAEKTFANADLFTSLFDSLPQIIATV